MTLTDRVGALDPELAKILTPRADAFRHDEDDPRRIVSEGWRSTKNDRFSDLGVRLPSASDATVELGVSRFEHLRLRVRLENAQPSPAQLIKGRVVYTNAFAATDRVFASSLNQLEEMLLIRGASAPTAFAWKVELPKGIQRGEMRDGVLLFLDAQGATVLRVGKPFAVDASGARVELDLVWDDATSTIRIAVAHQGLQYPVVVDPGYIGFAFLATSYPGVGSAPDYRGAGAALGYNAVDKKVVIVGGCRTALCPIIYKTWTLRSTGLWDDIAGSMTGRAYTAMVYDANLNQMVLFGGAGTGASDTWTQSGDTWTLKAPATVPPGRYGHSMAYDAARVATIMFGGTTTGGDSNETWAWNGTTWTQLTPVTSPPPRRFAAMAYDSAVQKTILFGGLESGTNTYLGDTWLFDGTTWTQASPTSSPPARATHAMAYDKRRGSVVIFGGKRPTLLNDAWYYNGTTWVNAAPATAPTARAFPAMVYDELRSQLLIYGGGEPTTLLDDTWVSSGSSGGTCGTSATCADGLSCVDGVCCATACTGNCQSCRTSTNPGTCTNIVMASDADTCPASNGKYCNASSVCVDGTVGCGTSSVLCSNGMRDALETDVDCGGGLCTKCALSKRCLEVNDCASGACVNFTCRTGPTCTDGVRDGTESDVDCGGSCALKCATGLVCNSTADCVSGSAVCTAGRCLPPPTCTDSIRNQTETDVDCGGATCGASCAGGRICLVNTDCVSGSCSGGPPTRRCDPPPSCTDSIKNGSETDADCGGPCGATCITGQVCLAAGDCVSANCIANRCAPAPTCTDGTKNGTETDVDCGGSCATKCVDLKACSVAADCVNNSCISNVCTPPGESGILMVHNSGATWLWDGADWVSKTAPTGFAARDIPAAIAFEPTERRVVLFGGRRSGNGVPLNETWEWDGFTGWKQGNPANKPGYRYAQNISADPTNGVVMYGGEAQGASAYTDQFTYRGRNWTSGRRATNPAQRSYSAMVYDSVRNQHVVFGGDFGVGSAPDVVNGLYADTWTLNASSMNWTKRVPATRPLSRAYHAMAFDPVRQEVVLFGGYTTSPVTRLNDTWVWNGTTWTQRSPGTSPTGRQSHEMAWDPVSSRVILFGGYTGSAFMSDTWAWNGTTWTQLTPTTVPTASSNTAMTTYIGCNAGTCTCSDSTRNGAESDTDCGGTCSTKCANNRKCFANADCASGTCTSGVCEAATCSDGVKNGTESDADCGVNCATKCGDQKLCASNGDCRSTRCVAGLCRAAGVLVTHPDYTRGPYIFDGTDWVEQPVANMSNTPATPGAGHSIAYNAATKKIIHFSNGDTSTGGTGGQNATWQWDLTGWTQLSPTTVPAKRYGTQMAYDPVKGGILMFGGQSRIPSYVDYKDLHFFGLGGGTDWTLQTPPATVPAWRSYACTAYDSARARTVMFGGVAFNTPAPALSETWEYDSAANIWTKKTPTVVPPQYSYCAMAYDPVRNQTILNGGWGSASYDTFVWDGTDWTKVRDPGGPSGRHAHNMAWDPVRQQIMLYGGLDSGSVAGWYLTANGTPSPGACKDTWSWDGFHWQRITTANTPNYYYGSMAGWNP